MQRWREGKDSPAKEPADAHLQVGTSLASASEKRPHNLFLGHQGKSSRGCLGNEAAILDGGDNPCWRRYGIEEGPELQRNQIFEEMRGEG